VTYASDGAGSIGQPDAVKLVTLQPEGDASLVTETLEYTAGHACPPASGLAMTPAGARTALRVRIVVLASDPCGAIDTSPVYAGSGPQP
jgi:hypothetical protein